VERQGWRDQALQGSIHGRFLGSEYRQSSFTKPDKQNQSCPITGVETETSAFCPRCRR
jgi:hypothetical protein